MKKIKLQLNFLLIHLGIVFFVIGTFFVFISLKESDKTILNLFSLIGTNASLIGLLLTYLQVLKIKYKTEEINKSVTETKQNIQNFICFIDISNSVNLIEEIQKAIKNSDNILAASKMKDLKKNIFKIITIEDGANNVSNLGEFCTQLTIDLISLSSNDEKIKSIDMKKIFINLENLADQLLILGERFKTKML